MKIEFDEDDQFAEESWCATKSLAAIAYDILDVHSGQIIDEIRDTGRMLGGDDAPFITGTDHIVVSVTMGIQEAEALLSALMDYHALCTGK